MNKTIVAASVVGLAVLALYPVLIPNPYYIHLFETILIYAILLFGLDIVVGYTCLLYTSPSPRDRQKSRMPSSA